MSGLHSTVINYYLNIKNEKMNKTLIFDKLILTSEIPLDEYQENGIATVDDKLSRTEVL